MSTVKLSGPIFDGTAERASARGCEAIRAKVAEMGEILAGSALMASIRREHTGRAVRSVTTTDKSTVYQTGKYSMPVVAGPGETIVTTDLATYGPWLEGSGSRNETTRFKGYHSFRIATQELDAVAEGLAEDAFQPYLREMQLCPSTRQPSMTSWRGSLASRSSRMSSDP